MDKEMMRSLLLEYFRLGTQDTGLLREGDDYLMTAGGHQVRQLKMTINDKSFRCLMQALRYKGSAAERLEALRKIGSLVTDILGIKHLPDLNTEEAAINLDLVTNAVELAALPFETATDESGIPIVVRDKGPVVLTRRVRQNSSEVRMDWPACPRILFAWACPPYAGVDVPYEAHASALRAALEPWIPAGGPSSAAEASSVLTIVKEASLDSIKKAIAECGPFSHVHLLAHGCTIDRGFDQRFGMALHEPTSGELRIATSEEIMDALAPLRGQPVILTLAACDAANDTNTIIPDRSIAHELHVSGIPVVVASQLPLTVPGSTLVVQHFYGRLLEGKDVREALYQSRAALYRNSESTHHDWASLVAYVRLPDTYSEHLCEVRLQSALASLKNLRNRADELLKSEECDPAHFDQLASLLRGRIELLQQSLSDSEKANRKGVLEENLGLLGSAEKRLAELYFEGGRRGGAADWQQSMRASLERSRDWYRKGFEGNLSHHWDGVQFLSLEAVLSGKINDPNFWRVAFMAAEIEHKKAGEFWACGSLAELCLLAPLAGMPDASAKAAEFLKEMKNRVEVSNNPYALETTERQFRRYVSWWTNQNGFFPGMQDLADKAKPLADIAMPFAQARQGLAR
jgi:hypothetical protein